MATTERTTPEVVRRLIVLGLILTFLISSCAKLNFRLPAWGKAGKYRTGKNLFLQPGEKGANEALPHFEALAKEDPFYEDTLTYLGRTYYRQKRYPAALEVLRRAILVNKDDEIAWLTLGLVQLRIGDAQEGLESYKGGLALLSKVIKHGYRGYYTYDRNGLVRSSIRRAIFQVNKDGLTSKQRLIRAGELILRRIDDEEVAQASDKGMETQIEMGG